MADVRLEHRGRRTQKDIENCIVSINKKLPQAWEVRADMGQQARLYYINHNTQTSQWIPPQESWKDTNNGGSRLPYGWEEARDPHDKPYYINHVDKTTSNEAPKPSQEEVEPPQVRQVELTRDPQLGFGFVAGSEKPVVVRFVTENGPSEGKLLPGDQILSINDEDVKDVARERVIELVRSCTERIRLTVSQPELDNSARKSALLTAAKKARLKNNPSRVRFAESVIVNGDHVPIPSNNESYIPLMPNVLKVFLENGQTKSFKYDSKTNVKDVLLSLEEKLGIKHIEHFALVLQNMKTPTHRHLAFLQEGDTLAEVAARPGSQHFKCLLRFAFLPSDLNQLLQDDPIAFEYLYLQCCNDVTQERYASELKFDVALQLAASHIVQYAIANNISVHKISLKSIEKDCGLETFLAQSILNATKTKDLRKMLNHCIKTHPGVTMPGSKQPIENMAKLHYIIQLSVLRSFGGKCFVATLVKQRQEAIVVVGPQFGISVITNMKNNTLAHRIEFKNLKNLKVSKETERMDQVEIITSQTSSVVLSMVTDEVLNFVALVEGYFRLESRNSAQLTQEESADPEPAPPYDGVHVVVEASWNYPVPEGVTRETSCQNARHSVDLSKDPPPADDSSPSAGVEVEEIPEEVRDNSEKKTVPEKPKHLVVAPEIVQAPLASPDISTISGSSDSSIAQETNELSNGDTVSENLWLRNNSDSNVHATLNESDILTNGEVESILQKSVALNEDDHKTSEMNPSNCSLPMATAVDTNGSDSRFGIKSFRTFSSPVPNDSADKKPTSTESDRLLPPPADEEPNSDSGSTLTLNSDRQGTLGSTSELSETGSGLPYLDMIQSGSDTDDTCTPTDSPAKVRLDQHLPTLSRIQETDRPQSFGLHSPDQLPATEDQYKHIAVSFGLQSPAASENLTLAPAPCEQTRDEMKGACGGEKSSGRHAPVLVDQSGLYLDPDIIDLTFLPPPPSEEEVLLDFASSDMVPPPDFEDVSTSDVVVSDDRIVSSDPSPVGQELPAYVNDLPESIRKKIDRMVMNDEELDIPMSDIEELMRNDVKVPQPLPLIHDADQELESGIGSGEDSGNETISSENVDMVTTLPETNILPMGEGGIQKMVHKTDAFDTQEIDDFIAQMTIPPPPGDKSKAHISLGESSVVQSHTLSGVKEELPLTVDDGVQSVLADLDNSFMERPNSFTYEEDLSTRESWERLLKAHGLTNDMPHDLLLEEEFARLVIPPPPISTDADLGSLPVVPPVPVTPEDSSRSVSGQSSPDTQSCTSTTNISPKSQSSGQGSEVVAVKIRPSSDLRSPAADDINMHKRGFPLKSFDDPKPSKGKSWLAGASSRSAESSPIHRVAELYAHSRVHNVMGTLPRSLNRAKKAPPPPPRRSSMPGEKHLDDLKEVSDVANGDVFSEKDSPQNGSSKTEVIYDSPCNDVFSPDTEVVPEKPNTDSETESLVKKPSVISGPKRTLKSTGSSTKKSASPSASHSVEALILQYSQGIDNASPGNPGSPSFDISKPISTNGSGSKFNTLKSKLKSYVSPVHKKSPGVSGSVTSPKISSKEKDKSLASTDLDLRKSEFLNSSSSSSTSPRSPIARTSSYPDDTQKRPYSSPKTSPLIARHTSLLENRDSSPRTFKTFFSGSERRTSVSSASSSDSAGGTAKEPKLDKSESEIPEAKAATSEKSKEDKQKCASVPIKINRTRLSSSGSSASEASQHDSPHPASPSSQSSPWRSPFQPPSSTSFHIRSRSQDDDEVKLPPWRTRSPGWSTFKSDKGSTTPPLPRRSQPPKPERKMEFKKVVKSETSKVVLKQHEEDDKTSSNDSFFVFQNKVYEGENCFTDANGDVIELIKLLTKTVEKLGMKTSGSSTSSDDFSTCKEELVSHSRQFVTDSKLLVSSATHSKEKLIQNVNSSMHTLVMIVQCCQVTIATMNSEVHGRALGSKVKDVANAYKTTVDAAHNAAGMPLSDPNMKMLMRQATSLAAILSIYMKSLKAMDNK